MAQMKQNIDNLKLETSRLSVYGHVHNGSVIDEHGVIHLLSIIKQKTHLFVHIPMTRQELECENVQCVFDAFTQLISRFPDGVDKVTYTVTNDGLTY